MEGAPASLELPADYPRQARAMRRAGTATRVVGGETSRALGELARVEGASPLDALLAGYAVVLARLAGQRDVVVGAPISGQMLPIRVELDARPSFRSLVRGVTATRRAHEGAAASFDAIVSAVGAQADPTRTPIFQVSIELDDSNVEDAKLDVALRARFDDRRTVLRAIYDADLFAAARIDELLAQLECFLDAAVRAPDSPVLEHSIVTAAARAILPDPAAPLDEPRYENVPAAIDRHASATPDACALVHGETRWSYAELRDRSRAVAAALEAAGVQARDRVAIAGSGCPGVVATALAVWRIGAVIVGLSDNFPVERRKLMADLAGARICVLVGDGPAPVDLPSFRVDAMSGAVSGAPRLDPKTASKETRGDPAYVIFTSGTTGVPKGVLGRTNSLAHFVSWQRDQFGLGPGDRGSQLHNISFDPVQRDMFTVLVSGGTLCFPPRPVEELEPAALLEWLKRSGITMLHHVPSMIDSWLSAWPDEATVASMRWLFIAGEPLTDALAKRCRKHFPNARIVNLYGPAETTMAKFFYEVPTEPRPGTQRVGRPLPHGQAILLGEGGAMCGIGEPGEIVIRTPFRTLGYVGGDDRRRFRQNPFAPEREGDVVYFSGDRGRYALDGELEIFGRVDDQVKVHGVRVEPGEVAAVLESHPALAKAFVTAFKDDAGQNALAAYVVCKEGASIEVEELRRFLTSRVLLAMVPSAFVFLDKLPLTANGKVDRKALPAPKTTAVTAPYVAPRSEVEKAIADAFATVLGRDRVGVDDDFFSLGGQSLLAIRVLARVRERLGVSLVVRDLFEAPTVAKLAARCALPATRDEAIGRVPRESALPASSAEARLWFLDQLEPGRSTYNLPLAFRVRGALDRRKLEEALAALVARHESLRTRFVAREGAPVRVIDPPAPVRVSWIEVAEAELPGALAREARRPFDLGAGPPLRAAVFRAAGDDHVVLLTMHHIASDGWSNEILARELWTLYGGAQLPEPAIQYADWAAWERRTMDTHAAQLEWWRNALAGLAPIELPTDRPRAPVRDGRGATHAFSIDAEAVSRLEALGRREGATLFMTLLASFDALLSRLSGRRDVAVGIPVAHRARVETEAVVGLFVNTLVVRVDLAGNPTRRELLARVREATLGAHANADVPFERLVEELAPERIAGRTPLFDVMFALDDAPAETPASGLSVSRLDVEIDEAKFDLALSCVKQRDGSLRCTLEYATALFDRETVERMGARFVASSAWMASSDDARLAEWPLLDAAERRRLLVDWNGAPAPSARACAHELVARWARDTPDAIALVDGDRRLTYAALEARSRAVSARLRAAGVRRGDVVALSAVRRIESFVGIVAVLQSGAAYAPIDPTLPKARRAQMIARCAAAVGVGFGDFEDLVRTEIRLDQDETAPNARALESTATLDDALVVLHTSGTTGEPKGVLLPHRGLVSYARAMTDAWEITRDDRVLQFAALSFDTSLEETLVAWTAGATLVLRDDAMLQPDVLLDACERYRITLLGLPTAHFALVAAVAETRGWPAAVRRVVIGGERVDAGALERFHRTKGAPRLTSMYGPTEASISVTAFESRGPIAGAAPLGKPVAGCRVYVLDDRLSPVPIGTPGELCIGGAPLALGYLADGARTAERFVPNPFATGERLYRTGDLARWRPDGTLEFLGRVDDQVKIRGFRVEPSEIAATLARCPNVAEAVVLARPNARGESALVAYARGDGGALDASALHAFAAERLPAYMVPAAIVAVERWPLDAHGKIDRRALPAPDESDFARGAFREPITDVEKRIAAIFADVLCAARVGLDDDFFALGGHSLLATKLVARVRHELGVDLGVRALFERPTVQGLAERIAAAAPASRIERAPRDRPMPLSAAEERLWFLEHYEPGRPTYNVTDAFRIRGALDEAALEAALSSLVERHEALRTRYVAVEGKPVREIDAPGRVTVERISVDSADALIATVTKLARRSFDLAAGPLFRPTLVRRAAGDAVLVLSMHHIVVDAWSSEVIARELGALYEAAREGRKASLETPELTYADYAAWQRSALEDDGMRREIEHWRKLLDSVPALELPTDRPRPALQSTDGSLHRFDLDASLAAKLRAISQRHGTTIFMTMLAAFGVVLARRSGQTDFAIGAPIARRARKEMEHVVGMFLDTVPLRLGLAPRATVADLLASVKQTTLDAWAHDRVPFERLVSELKVPRDPARTPIFQVMLASNVSPHTLDLAGAEVTRFAIDEGIAKFDLTLFVEERGEDVGCALEYATALFDAETAAAMASELCAVASAMAEDPARCWRDLPLPESERRELLVEFNATGAAHEMSCLHGLFERQARRSPERTALVHAARRMTYGELDRRSNQLAHALRERGVRDEALVAVSMERSIEMIVAVLGILKAGGAVLPVDPTYPRERRELMLADARAALVLDDRGLDGVDAQPEAPPARADRLDALLYAIFTSGSTGRPKAVGVTHRCLANLLAWQAERDARPPGPTLQFTSLSFDVSFQEIFATLGFGGELHLVDREQQRDAAQLFGVLAGERIARLFLPFVALENLAHAADGRALPELREIVTAGEQLRITPAIGRFFRANPQCTLENQYGPSETHVVTSERLAGDVARWPALPPIGRPVSNTRVYVLDDAFRPMPILATGEIYLAGDGVARGYVGRPDVTAERFVPDPFGPPGSRMYRTGDLGRFRRDGTIEFLGRNDHQVKVRGYRIELGEVEVAIAALPGVRQCAVVAPTDASGARMLVAHVAPALDAETLRVALRARLPEHMVPSFFVSHEALPLTPSGKIDRRALPAPDASSRARATFRAPETELERRIASIFAELLHAERVGLDDDFFALGGHSLLATQLVARVRRDLGVELTVRTIFERPSVAQLSDALRQKHAAPAARIEPVPRDGPLPLSFAESRLWFLDQYESNRAAYGLPVAYRLRGDFDERALERALSRLVARHEALRTRFVTRDGEPARAVDAPGRVEIEKVRLDSHADLASALARLAHRPFDLARGPLFRATLVRIADDDHALLLAMHHIVSDGWSLGVLERDLWAMYGAEREGAEIALAPLAIQYADYAAWERRVLAGHALDGQLEYWRAKLEGVPPTDLPTDRSRPAVRDTRGATHVCRIDRDTAARVEELARREGVTPFIVLLTAFKMLLARTCGQTDVAVGTALAHRTEVELEGLVGFFVNTLVLRTDVGGHATVRELLARVRETTLAAHANQDVPFERLVEELRVPRDASRTPLVQTMFVLENAPASRPALPGLQVEPVPLGIAEAKFDLSVVCEKQAGGEIDCSFDYATALFERSTVERLARHFRNLVARAVETPDRPATRLPILDADERARILHEPNQTVREMSRGSTLADLFEAGARRWPDAIAVLDGGSHTYRELDEHSSRLAHRLQRVGVRRGSPVVIWMKRSFHLVSALLAVPKAGATYVPIAIDWPLERVRTILSALDVRVVITDRDGAKRVRALRLPKIAHVVCLDEEGRELRSETVDEQAVQSLWDHVADAATDRVTAGGFVSSFTGEPFSPSEVDEYVERVVGLARPWARSGARVMEIGSGAGTIARALAPGVARYVAVDPSPRALDQARAAMSEASLSNVEVVRAFAHDEARLPRGPFDLVVMASTVQFFPGPVYLRNVIASLMSRLAPGGALVIADVPDVDLRDDYTRALEAHRAARGRGAQAADDRIMWMSADELVAIAHAVAGVADVRVERRERGFDNELRYRFDVVLTRGERAPDRDVRAAAFPVVHTGGSLRDEPTSSPPRTSTPDDVAYIIHTSGSTGTPKGVMITHAPAVNVIEWVNRTFEVGSRDRLLFVTSPTFDLSVYDVFGALAAGATLRVASEEELKDPNALVTILAEEGITFWDSAPAALQQLAPLLTHVNSDALRLVFLSGDWIPLDLPDAVRASFPRAEVISLGGATEATIWSNYFRVGRVDPAWRSIPYGAPIQNARYHVLDASLEPVPVGVPGDLYIGGECLALGYANDPALTAGKFVPDPFSRSPGARLYKTGDRARYDERLVLEFLGRVDHQVKVRGYRIELGEIESVLRKHPAVRDVVVDARGERTDRRLVAYVVPSAAGKGEGELRAFVREELPEYMVPSAFVLLEAFPVTPNGKLDRKALPAPKLESAEAYVAPRTDNERTLCEMWRELLGVERVGVRDDFFALGGHSLLAVKLIGRVRDKLGIAIPVGVLFEGPTVERLARVLDAGGGELSTLLRLRDGDSGAAIVFVGSAGGKMIGYMHLLRALGGGPVLGLRALGLARGEAALENVSDIAAHHVEALKKAHPGPYVLVGWSFGGVLAFEIARQLAAVGRTLRVVGIDCYPSTNAPIAGERALLDDFLADYVAVHGVERRLAIESGTVEDAWRAVVDSGIIRADELDDMQRSFSVFAANIRASCTYAPIEAPVRFLWLPATAARGDHVETAREVWKRAAASGFEETPVAGDHHSMMHPPNVAGVASLVERVRDELLRGGS